MPTNNQNLPPVPAPPNSQIPPVPPLAFEKTEQVNFTESGFRENQNNKWIIFAVALIFLVVSIGVFAFSKTSRKDASDIEVSENQATFQWKNMEITAQLAPKETTSFVTNGGQLDSRNTGLFGVILSDKVRYLEQKYGDIIHCGSAGEAETKSLEYSANFIANNSNAESGLQDLDKLVKKGNWVEFEIEGSRVMNMQGNQSGKNISIRSSPELVFYLVDYLSIVRENYQ